MAIRVISYNILADAYIRRAYYPNTRDAALDPERRLGVLCERVAALDADVLCLQEVQPHALDALGAHLDSHRMCWASKGRSRPDGCATFVRSERIAVRREKRFEYGDGSGHVALLTWLAAGRLELAVANTHLRWSPPTVPAVESPGYRQLREVVACIDSDRWVVCGDFNMEPEHPALELLDSRGMRDVYAGSGELFTCNSNREAKRIDFVFVGAGLHGVPLPIPRIDDHTPLPSESEPSDHLPIGANLDRVRPAAGNLPARVKTPARAPL